MDVLDDDLHVDGNAALGPFAEFLGVDVSASTLCCAGCGTANPLAATVVYDRGPGMVMRCPHCGDAMARLVRTPADVWLDLRGATAWRIPMPGMSLPGR